MVENNKIGIEASEGSSRRADFFYILLIIAVVLAANYRMIFYQETYQILENLSYDFWFLLGYHQAGLPDFYRTSVVPLWWPSDSFGIPSVGVFINGILNPVGPIILPLLSFPYNIIVLFIIQFSLLGVFSYLFFRRLNLSNISSFFVSVWMIFSGSMIMLSYIWVTMNALIGLFFCMWVILGLLKNQNLRMFALLALGGCYLFLSGDITFIIYIFYFITLWLLIFSVYSISTKQKAFSLIIIISVSVILVMLLAGPQMLSSAFYFTHCIRAEGVSLSEYQASFDPTFIIQQGINSPLIFLITNLLIFSRKLPNVYFGLIPVVFCIFGLVWQYREPAVKASIILGIVLILILFASPLGLYKILYYIPFLSVCLFHYRLQVFLQLCILVIAGFGIDALILRRPGKITISLLFIFGLLNIYTISGVTWKILSIFSLAGVLASLYKYRKYFSLFLILLTLIDVFSFLWYLRYPLTKPVFWREYSQLLESTLGNSRSQVMFPAPEFSNFNRNTSLPIQVGTFVNGEAFDTALTHPYKPTVQFYLSISRDIVSFIRDNYTEFDFSTNFKSTDFINETNRHLVNLSNLRYIFCEDMALKEAERRPILCDPDYLIKYPWINGFEPFKRKLIKKGEYELPVLCAESSGEFKYSSNFDPEGFVRFSLSLEGSANSKAVFKLLWQAPGDEGTSEIFNHALTVKNDNLATESELFQIPLDMTSSGQGILIFKAELDEGADFASWINPEIVNHEKTIKWLAGEGRLMAFENTEYLPRGRILHDVIYVEEDSQALNILKDRSLYDPAIQTILFDKAPRLEMKGNSNKEQEWVKVLNHLNVNAEFNTQLEYLGWLVVSDAYYPGWRAYVDGKEKRIFRADYLFRGLPLEPGRHSIIMKFVPFDIRIGLWAALASFTFMACFFFILFIRRKIYHA